MKTRYQLVLLAMATMLCACKSQNRLLQTGDSSLTVQVMRLPADDKATVSYKVRLITSKSLLEGKTTEQKNAMWYKMDSCFYLQQGTGKIYAALVQPVANGVSNTYEYLVEFDNDKEIVDDNVAMVYDDKYLNRRKYIVKTQNN